MTTPATSPDLPDDGYVLARTSQEYQRLRAQARLWEEVTARALDRVGIGAIGVKLPLHFAAAGLGEPDGTDVAGQLRPLAEIGGLFQAVYQSMLPAGLRLGLTTEAAGQAFVAEISEAIRQRRGVGMAPLMVSSWKHKPQGKRAGHPTGEI